MTTTMHDYDWQAALGEPLAPPPMFVGLTAAAPQEQPAAAPAIDWPSIWDHVGPWLLIASACAAAIIVTDYLKGNPKQ